jgi:hypothetical protein
MMMHPVSGVAVGNYAGTPLDLLAEKHAERDTYSHTNPDYLASMQRGSCAGGPTLLLADRSSWKIIFASPMN